LPPILAITITNDSASGHLAAKPARFSAINNGWPNQGLGNYGAEWLKWSESELGASCIRFTGSAQFPLFHRSLIALHSFHRRCSQPSAIMEECFPAFGRELLRSQKIQPSAHNMSHETPKPKRAAGYARRLSKHPQTSIARQMAVIRKYAERRGLIIVKNYSDGAKGGGKT